MKKNRKKATTFEEFQKQLQEVGVLLLSDISEEAGPLLVDAFKASYPPEHVRTGSLRNAIEYKVGKSGKTVGMIRIRAGVWKKKIKATSKRRKGRTGLPNYGQFHPWILKDSELAKRVLESVIKKATK